jgi:hypothetical protein
VALRRAIAGFDVEVVDLGRTETLVGRSAMLLDSIERKRPINEKSLRWSARCHP